MSMARALHLMEVHCGVKVGYEVGAGLCNVCICEMTV